MKRALLVWLVSLTGILFASQNVLYLSIADTIFINEWLLCGPFLVGTREGLTEAIEDISAIEPKEGESLRSPLVQGGVVKWRKIPVDSSGWLATNYEHVLWDSIQDYYGISGLTSLGYAYAEFACSTRCRALAVAQRCGFILNGRGYVGDIYANGWFKTPVVLDSGINRFILRISGYGDQKVRFLLVPAPEPIIPVVADATTPDIVADETTNSFIGIPFLNTTLQVVDSIKIIIAIDTIAVVETIVNNIPILGGEKVAFPIKLPPIPYDSNPIPLYLKTKWRDYQRTDTINLRIRNRSQGHKRTFLSEMDSSCQYYAILYPKEYDPKKKYGLILSLHGAGVEASGLIECFKPKDWAFVVCPTNRRPYGFDWQDWGRLDALEVLNTCLKKLPIDPNRVYLTGHSMGGHGTWHIGLAHPDRFAAIAPEAGWPSFPLYVPNFLQRSIIFSEPQKLAIREMATRPDNTPAFIENAFILPVFILHGGNDDNVPTLHGRNFALWLDALGYNYRYKEVPEKGHWWNYEDGTACVDDPELMNFFATHERNPGPREIRFRTADLGQSAECYWVKIDRVNIVGNDAVVNAKATDSLITINTTNILQLTLNLEQELFFPHPIRIDIDGETVASQLHPPARLTFHKTARGWRSGKPKYSRLKKTPEVYGPAKQVLMKPWRIVYGTLDKNIAEDLRHAANQEALRWWLIGNGAVEVFPDTLADLSDKRNLVLLGGPKENLLTKQIASYLPIRIKDNEVQIPNNFSVKDSVAIILTYPNPINPGRLILIRMGTNPASTKLSLFWGVIGSGTAIPDFMIFDRRVRRFGWAGVIAAGFWGPDWNFDPRSTFIQQ